MSNFGRVLRLAFRHPWSVAGVVVTALLVGVLWGGNIGAIYPMVEIAFRGKSLHYWADLKIQECHQRASQWSQTMRVCRQKLALAPPESQEAILAELRFAETAWQAEQAAAARYARIAPYLKRFTPDDPLKTLALIIGLLLAATALKNVALVGNTILVARLAQLTTFQLRNEFFRRTLRMDVATFTNEGTADLMSRFTHDMECVGVGLNTLFGKMVREPLKMIACLVGAAVVSWRLLVLSLLIVPPALLAIRWLGKMLKRANRRAMEEMAQLYATLEEAFRGIKIVKSCTMERAERRRFHATSKAYFRKGMKIARYDALAHPLTEILGIGTISLAMLAGAYLVLEGQTHLLGVRMSVRPLSMPDLVLFYAMLAGAADPIRKLSEVFSGLQRAAAASDRIYAMLDREPQVRDCPNPMPLPRHSRDLVFEGVHFAYVPGRPVLKDIHLRVRFGETVAIVGPSGCGKTTLASLIPRFADPTAGTIRLDGLRLDQVRLRDLRGQIGLVTQEPVLFDDTVLNNIRYGAPGASPEAVIEAAKRANAHRFIEENLPDGYQTRVGPMGSALSGGQRQRIALARAILRDPAILLLDEPTSQVDMESEQLIWTSLARFARGRTTIVVTHRLGMLALADRIVVMNEGRILDVGTHSELMGRCPFYRRLCELQFEELKASA